MSTDAREVISELFANNHLAAVLVWLGYRFQCLLFDVEYKWSNPDEPDEWFLDSSQGTDVERSIRGLMVDLRRVSGRLQLTPLSELSESLINSLTRAVDARPNPRVELCHGPLDLEEWARCRAIMAEYLDALPDGLGLCISTGMLIEQVARLDDDVRQDPFYGEAFPIPALEASLVQMQRVFPMLEGLDVAVEARCTGGNSFHEALFERVRILFMQILDRLRGNVPRPPAQSSCDGAVVNATDSVEQAENRPSPSIDPVTPEPPTIADGLGTATPPPVMAEAPLATVPQRAPPMEVGRANPAITERDDTFLRWDEEGMTPARMRDRWNRENPHLRIRDGKWGCWVVKSGIARAKKRRRNRGDG